jgi:hypothetical protein
MAGQVPPTSGMIIFTVSASTHPTACEGPGSNGGQNNVWSQSLGDFLLPPMISSLSHLTPLAGPLTLLPFPLYFSALVAALGKQTLQKTKCDKALPPSMGWRHLTSPLLYQCAVHSPALPFLPSLSLRAAFFLIKYLCHHLSYHYHCLQRLVSPYKTRMCSHGHAGFLPWT